MKIQEAEKLTEKELKRAKKKAERLIQRKERIKLVKQFFVIVILIIVGGGAIYFSPLTMPQIIKNTGQEYGEGIYPTPKKYNSNIVHALIDDQFKLESKLKIALRTLEQHKDKLEELRILKEYLADLKAGRITINIDYKSGVRELIEKAIDKAHAKYPKVEKEIIRAVMKQESQFNPLAVSHVGAMGLMQLMPKTSDWLGVKNPWNIEENIMAGTQYLNDQLVTFKGDYKLALAGYNAGPNAVKKFNWTVPPYPETQDYVKKVMRNYYEYKSQSK